MNNQLIQWAENKFHSLCYDTVFIPDSISYYLQPLMFEQIVLEKILVSGSPAVVPGLQYQHHIGTG